MKKPHIEITEPAKSWWSGDRRVEPFMPPVNAALDRSGLKGKARTDVYNRAYEAVYNAIKEHGETTNNPREENK